VLHFIVTKLLISVTLVCKQVTTKCIEKGALCLYLYYINTRYIFMGYVGLTKTYVGFYKDIGDLNYI
jgi:hypothetical protein